VRELEGRRAAWNRKRKKERQRNRMFKKRKRKEGRGNRRKAADNEKEDRLGLEDESLLVQKKRKKTVAENAAGVDRVVVKHESGATEERGDATRTGMYNESNVKDKKKKTKGPAKASAFIRTTTTVDYQQNICKDYKQLGVCGYGDNCIFLHDRSNVKTGAQLEKEYKERENKRKEMERNMGISDDDSDTKPKEIQTNLPHSCYICRKRFNNPVVTKCEHYFCMECAMQRYSSKTSCAVCGAQTNGIFNSVKPSIEKILMRDI
jgi:RING finger protein 113A